MGPRMTIDSHCHIHDEKYAHDLDDVLARAQHADVSHFVSIGCDIHTTERARNTAHHYESVFFTAGFHPHEAQYANATTLAHLKQLARDPKCVAIGECGLDYYYKHSSINDQKQAFSAQLLLADELDLPVVIHLRDAFDDCVAILKQHPSRLRCTVIHCFSGTLEQAKIFADLGCFISISGIITFKKPGDLPMVAQQIALDRLLVETDAPYLAPHPRRGGRNEPAFINFTLKAIADARGEDLAAVSKQIEMNTIGFFSLPPKASR